MNAGKERVLYYHADASPLGGYLTHPFEVPLLSPASVSLNQAGGHTEARSEGFKLDSLIHCGASYSRATGSVEKDTHNWTTAVTSVIEDINLAEVVTADRIVSQLSIEHPRDGYYPKISFVGCQFQNLRINGRLVTPEIDFGLLSSLVPEHTVRSVMEGDMLAVETAPPLIEFPEKPWPDVNSFVNKAVDQSVRITSGKGAPDWLKRRFAWMESPEARNQKGYILSSLIHEVPGAAPGSSFGHVVLVPGFGNIFLGELIVDASSFRLSMLRAEMGCILGGNVSFGNTGGNGRPMP